MREKGFQLLFFLLFLAGSSVWFSSYLYQRQAALALDQRTVESDAFRRMNLSEGVLLKMTDAVKDGLTPSEILTALHPFCRRETVCWPRQWENRAVFSWRSALLKNNRAGYQAVWEAYAAIWDDVECFPVAVEDVSYENTWMFERTYGGLRGHEGTDLIPDENLSGIYPIVSMTDGVVEKVGWLEQGGYRIGIRSTLGGYFYYAHLDSYAREFQVGDIICAGERLGLMGDTGYGKEGTRGMFDVHLHLGIYIRTAQVEELSVNPYWVLRYAEKL
ncbi:MAG: M23 family metallopeptidase [Lachnospiraceae bacterium]|nr:M23 family metallopeptidase [Lachnospiraceae bacterium]